MDFLKALLVAQLVLLCDFKGLSSWRNLKLLILSLTLNIIPANKDKNPDFMSCRGIHFFQNVSCFHLTGKPEAFISMLSNLCKRVFNFPKKDGLAVALLSRYGLCITLYISYPFLMEHH